MSRLSEPYEGKDLKLRKRHLDFSYWPMFKTTRRFGLQSILFVSDPWPFMKGKISNRCPPVSKAEAHAYLDQAKSFYQASQQSELLAAKPLLMYYCFMNLAKAFVLTIGQQDSFGQTQHGLHFKPGTTSGNLFTSSQLDVHNSPNRNGQLQVFEEFLKAVGGSVFTGMMTINLAHLIPQVVVGHRIWANAMSKKERFISIEKIAFIDNSEDNKLWIQFLIFRDDLTRSGIAVKLLLEESRLSQEFRQVKYDNKIGGRELICLEQINQRKYTGRAADEVQDAVNNLRKFLWTTVTSIPPYRKHYIYLSPLQERTEILPQLLSIYAIMYCLGSISRYRPQDFEAVLSSIYGGFVQEFLFSQPLQFVYLLASEFAQRDVTRPAIV